MPRKGRRAFARGFFVLMGSGMLAHATPVVRAASPEPIPRAADAPDLSHLSQAELMETIRWLASSELQGRLAGSPEYLQAAREAAARLRRWGLRPLASADPTDPVAAYFQELRVEYNRIERCGLSLTWPDGATEELSPGTDHACRGLTGSAELDAPIVFVGYGLSSPDAGYDDYAGLDVRGKIVLAFKEAPPFQADSAGWGGTWMPRPKGVTAAAHGAKALLIVSRPGQEHPQRPIGSMLEGEAEHDPDFPRIQISVPIAERILAASGLDLRARQEQIDSTHASASIELPVRARIDVQTSYDPEHPSVNVLGLIEGSDPARRDEVIVLGAHLDHVGNQGALYYPGANDNASGSAVVLAIAHALAATEVRPARSILFALWSSEEAGLLGARRFVENCPIPRERIVAYLNFDCVGHGDSLEIGGGEEYPGFWAEARRLDEIGARRLVPETRRGGGADAEPFEEVGIPNLYFASRFSYTHLHQPSDRLETLNPELLEAIARVGGGLAWSIAQATIEAGSSPHDRPLSAPE